MKRMTRRAFLFFTALALAGMSTGGVRTMAHKRRRVYPPLLDTQSALVRDAIAAQQEPWYGAWTLFRDGRLKSALTKTPSVYAGGSVTPIVTYSQLDTDGHIARNLAIGWSLTLDVRYSARCRDYLMAWALGNDPVPFRETGDYVGDQGGYHQSYGYFSFAFAYDLVRATMTSSERYAVCDWLQDAADVMKGYQDHWAANHIRAGRLQYTWCDLTLSATDFDTGRNTASAPALAWLACAAASRYSSSIAALFDPDYPLNVPAIIHAFCAPDNEGDGVLDWVPNVQIHAGLTGGTGAGGVNYMGYGARNSALLYEMSNQLSRRNNEDEVGAAFTYLERFLTMPSPVPGDTANPSDLRTRLQIGRHLFGDDPVAAAGDYDIQYIGPALLAQPGL